MGKEKFDALMMKGSPNIDHTSEIVAMRRPDLSCAPETPRLKPEEVKFIRYELYYIKMKTLALTRRFETKIGQLRPDLSNMPAAPTSN
ncbi:MAG TPA: hypothetical protein VLK65_29345 [Vicinamibacteria bacterium]|nr:hypothetical protein [Vicinamibacteria bacterium]